MTVKRTSHITGYLHVTTTFWGMDNLPTESRWRLTVNHAPYAAFSRTDVVDNAKHAVLSEEGGWPLNPMFLNTAQEQLNDNLFRWDFLHQPSGEPHTMTASIHGFEFPLKFVKSKTPVYAVIAEDLVNLRFGVPYHQVIGVYDSAEEAVCVASSEASSAYKRLLEQEVGEIAIAADGTGNQFGGLIHEALISRTWVRDRLMGHLDESRLYSARVYEITITVSPLELLAMQAN